MVYNYTKPRGPIAAMYSSPGPCYALPTLVGQPKHDPRSVHYRGPAYPFGIRGGKWRDDCSPGPCYYPNAKMYRDGPDGTPHYSLYGRQSDLKTASNPGPGAYKPEDAGPTSKHSPPAYSFGSRHRNRRTDNTPGPNAYTVDPMLGKTVRSGVRQAPMITITGRSKIGGFDEDFSKTPGAGNYSVVSSDVNKSKAPSYSMTSRNAMPGDSTQKPGPGAHSPEKVYMNKKSSRSCYMGIRHSPYVCPLVIEPDY